MAINDGNLKKMVFGPEKKIEREETVEEPKRLNFTEEQLAERREKFKNITWYFGDNWFINSDRRGG